MDTTDAIILKAAPYSETTLLLTLLTRELGVVRVMARGARRERSSVQATFEPMAWIRCGLRIKSQDALGTLINPELEEGWDYLRKDLDKLAYAGLGLEVLGALAGLSAPEPRLFEEAVNFLSALGGSGAPGSLTIALLVRLLHEAGFPPQLEEEWTEATLPEALAYHFGRGRFEEARGEDPHQVMRMRRGAVLPLLKYMESPPKLDGSFVVGGQAGRVILRWLIHVWEDHLNEKLKAGRYFEKMIAGEKE